MEHVQNYKKNLLFSFYQYIISVQAYKIENNNMSQINIQFLKDIGKAETQTSKNQIISVSKLCGNLLSKLLNIDGRQGTKWVLYY